MSPSPSILIVDDQPDLRMLITLTFSGAGFRLREAADGETALAACAADPPDAVLVDVMMPGISGYEVCRALKADPRFSHTLVVLMTAGDQAVERNNAQLAGADVYIAKPFSPTQLLELVSSRIQGRRN